VVDPSSRIKENIARLGEQTGRDTSCWRGYLEACAKPEFDFAFLAARLRITGHPTPHTADLPQAEATDLFARVIAGTPM